MPWDESDSARIGVPVSLFIVAVSTLLWYWPRPPPTFLSNGDRKTAKIVEVREVSHDTKRFRLSLGSKEFVLGLPVGNHILLHAPNPPKCLTSHKWNGGDDPDRGKVEIERRYTPITGDDVSGYTDILVKIYRPGTHRMPGGEEKSFEDGGKMGMYLDNMRPGDFIDISGPLGNVEYLAGGYFKLSNRTLQKSHVAMIAGGSGITPMLQILRAALRDRRAGGSTSYTLLYANKAEGDILCQDLLQDLEQESKGSLRITYALEVPPPQWKGKVGLVSAAMLRESIPPASRSPLLMMCGPEAMVEKACKPNLEALGHKRQDMVVF
mmetsp:Transcript_43657/g.103004  ORF Transcript_43657/g.103004 Transcript_43657/m.103004 type:complete len:323 (+) Transcript_43657:95-1063(+)